MAQASELDKLDLIYVTGFGLFGSHTDVNASWEAVRLLPNVHTLPDGRKFRIKLLEIPVCYSDVDEAVQEIWKQNPKLVVHCGVGCSNVVQLEKHSFNCNYERVDAKGKQLECPVVPVQMSAQTHQQQCPANVVLCTALNVDALVTELGNSIPDVKCQASVDVGNYLCGYVYLKSLDRNSDRTLFVHVPKVNDPYSSVDVSRAILRIVELCMEQLKLRNIS